MRNAAKETAPFDLLALRPADTPAYMTEAWLSCLVWVARNPGALEAFVHDTGCTWTPGRSPLERMVDEATGRDRAIVEAFVRWVNVQVWGPIRLTDDDVDAR